MTFAEYFAQADAVSWIVAITLLLMSIASWVVIVIKAWVLRRAGREVRGAIAAFWQANDLNNGRVAAQKIDSQGWLQPVLRAIDVPKSAPNRLAAQVTRLLRDGKNEVVQRWEFGQVLLATVGSTAPFVGLLGTVWGIYHALSTIAGAGTISIDQVAGPVGEALVMTAAGLAVALPAVLAYNVLGRKIAQLATILDGFAYDLRAWLVGDERGSASDSEREGA